MLDPRNYGFGSTAAVTTSMGLVVGFDAMPAARATVLSGLLIVGLADNLTDALVRPAVEAAAGGWPRPPAPPGLLATARSRADPALP